MKRVKHRILICGLMLASTVNGQHRMSFIMTEHHIGYWAYGQHKDMCKILFLSMTNGSLQAYTNQGKPLLLHDIRTQLENVQVCDTFDDPVDPVNIIECIHFDSDFYPTITINSDTATLLYQRPSILHPNQEYSHKSNSDWALKILTKDFESLLSKENIMYIKVFQKDHQIKSADIPGISLDLLKRWNTILFNATFLTDCKVYKNDSLTRLLSPVEMKKINTIETWQYLPLDDESCHGYDSLVLMTCYPDDSSMTQGICVVLGAHHLQFNILALGSAFAPAGYFRVLGLMRTNEQNLLDEEEMGLLEYVLAWQLLNHLELKSPAEDAYIRDFKIKNHIVHEK